MMPWYQTPTLQMMTADMEWLQSLDCASCAVLEWYKGDCVQRETNRIRDLSEMEMQVVARRLGIDSPRFSQISQNLKTARFITEDTIQSLPASPSTRTPREDAMRKQMEYWKSRFESVSPKTSHPPEGRDELLATFPPKPPVNLLLSPLTSLESPKTSPTSPRGEERREEENREEPTAGPCGVAGPVSVRAQSEWIYQAYPRKVKKPAALKAIVKALQKRTFTELLALTQEFEKSTRGQEMRFVPHPSTWFNNEQFNDDPSTWSNSGFAGGTKRDPRTGLRMKEGAR